MSLRDWAGRHWEKPGVGAACVRLQDDHGQCIALLLWALWLAEDGRTPDPAAVRTAMLFCRSIDATRIERLRAVRRAAAPPERAALLERELDAERMLLDRLEAIPLSGARAHIEPAMTLAAISTQWGHPLASGAFDALIGAPVRVG